MLTPKIAPRSSFERLMQEKRIVRKIAILLVPSVEEGAEGLTTYDLPYVGDSIIERFRYSAVLTRAVFKQLFNHYRLDLTSSEVMRMRLLRKHIVTLGRYQEIRFNDQRLRKLKIDVEVIFEDGSRCNVGWFEELCRCIKRLPSVFDWLDDVILEVSIPTVENMARHYNEPCGRDGKENFMRLYLDLLYAFFRLTIGKKTLTSGRLDRNFARLEFEEALLPLEPPVAFQHIDQPIDWLTELPDERQETKLEAFYPQWKADRFPRGFSEDFS